MLQIYTKEKKNWKLMTSYFKTTGKSKSLRQASSQCSNRFSIYLLIDLFNCLTRWLRYLYSDQHFLQGQYIYLHYLQQAELIILVSIENTLVYQNCFCYLNVQNIKQNNSLFCQPIFSDWHTYNNMWPHRYLFYSTMRPPVDVFLLPSECNANQSQG